MMSVSAIIDQNASPNPSTPPKRARTADACSPSHPKLTKRARDNDDDDDECSSSHSSSTKSAGKTVRKSKPSTINAAIRYQCENADVVRSKLQELVWVFSTDSIQQTKTHFCKGSFVVNPENTDLYILVHLRRSVPETKWTKIMQRTGGTDFIMKPQDPWCNFYDFLVKFLPFTDSGHMTDNEDAFRRMADTVPYSAGLQAPYSSFEHQPHGSCQQLRFSSTVDEGSSSRGSGQPLQYPSTVGDGSISRASFMSSHHGQDDSISCASFMSSHHDQDDASSHASFTPLYPDQDGSSRASFASSRHEQDHMGLLEMSGVADIMDFTPRATDMLSHADLDLCKTFLSSDLPLPAISLDALVALVKNFFESLPDGRGRYALGLLGLPQWQILADVLHLENAVLSILATKFDLALVPNIAALNPETFPVGSTLQNAISELADRRRDAFNFRMQLVERTSLLYLLVIHMFSEMFTMSKPHTDSPLVHFTKNLIQDVDKLVRWRHSLAELAGWIRSVGMDSAGTLEPLLSYATPLPDVWKSFKPPTASVASHSTSITQQNMKIKSKVKTVADKLDITIDKGFASTVFWRMQENTAMAATLTVDSPHFRMLPPPFSSSDPASHTEDVQSLLDSLHFSLAALLVDK